MKRTLSQKVVGVTLVVAVPGCGSGMGAGSEEAPQTEQALVTVASDNFEGHALGALGAPWNVFPGGTGASTATVVSTTDHGQVLALHGSATSGESLTASLPAASSDAILRAQVDLKPATGASFVFDVQGTGGSIGARRVRVERAPGSDALVASSAGTSSITCATLPSNVWSTLAIDVRTTTSPHTFSVLLNGQPTACTNATTQMSAPFTAIGLMEASNAGWGGDVQLDNLLVTSDAAPCTPATTPVVVLDAGFNSTALGPLGAPWSVTSSADGVSTVRVIDAADHGRAARLHGGTASGQFANAALAFASTAPALSFEFAVRPAAESAFVFALDGTGASLGARRIRLERIAGSSTLRANTAGAGTVDCGTLPSARWSKVTLIVHTQKTPHTFDVLIDGATTACSAKVTEMSAPYTGVSLMDASNAGYGGDVDFDDMLAKGFAESTCAAP